MWKDPIVEDVRRVRQENAARLNYDIKAIVEDARKRQRLSKHAVVSFVSKKRAVS